MLVSRNGGGGATQTLASSEIGSAYQEAHAVHQDQF